MAIEYLCNCYDKGYCNGTRERDVCSCGGDERYCSFYPEKRKKALMKFDEEMSKEINFLANTVHNTLFYDGRDDETKPIREVRCANDQILAILDELRDIHEVLNTINSKL